PVSARRTSTPTATTVAETAPATVPAAPAAPAPVAATEPNPEIDELVAGATKALSAYSRYTQADIDQIVRKASVAALNQHGELAKHAVAETRRGVFEDKAVKNIFACEHVT